MSERNMKKREFVHATMLAKDYGLTRKMIEDLGEPDKRGPHRGYFSGELARMYQVDRVEVWVTANQEWLGRVNAARAKREAARKAAAEALRLAREAERLERLRRVTELVETAPVELRRPLPATLLDDAPSKYIHFSAKVDPFESNALRTYIRTNFTNHGKIQDELSWEERRSELGRRWRSRVDAFITGVIADWKKQHPAVSEKSLVEVYGLTPEMVQELGGPDEYAENPNEVSGPPTRLYLIKRVEAWVGANRDRVAKAKTYRVKQAADLRAAKKQQRLERLRQIEVWAETATVRLERPLPATLLDDARKEYRFPTKGNPFDSNALRAYIRKNFTNYGTLRSKLNGEENHRQLVRRLRIRVDRQIDAFITDWKKQHPDIVAAESAGCASEASSSEAA